MSVSAPEERLAALGRQLPPMPPPAGVYLPTVRTGNLVFTAGQLPNVEGLLPATGKVGADVDVDTAKELAAICALNALAAVKAEIGDLAKVRRVVKVVGFVASDPSFTDHPLVINGASELLGEVFGELGQHARSAVGVAALPHDTPVEIEMIVEVTA